MPISGPSSYIPTTDEFLAHWAGANAALAAPLTLRGDTAVADLQALRDALATQRTALTGSINDREFARGDIATLADKLIEKLDQFNSRVRVLFEEGSRYVNALPKVPDPRGAAEKVTTPLDDAASIWATIDGLGTPIVLADAYALADFNADIAALKTAYTAFTTAKAGEKLARATRNETQEKIYTVLKQYREAIPTYFAEDSAIVQTLPRLTPLPGHTPDPVQVQAGWNVTEELAILQWTASDDADLASYSVRVVAGATYDSDDEQVLATVSPEDERELSTDDLFGGPGSAVSYKVYVVLSTGNEAGSEAVTVVKP